MDRTDGGQGRDTPPSRSAGDAARPPMGCVLPDRLQGAEAGTATIGPAAPGLICRTGGDGSFSLWSATFGEGFHSGRGALREARETFLLPSELERFPPGSTIRVLEVCVGTGSNLAVLLEDYRRRGLRLEWAGLELDPEPLRLALSQPAFRAPWQASTLALLEQLLQSGQWHAPGGCSATGADSISPAGTEPQVHGDGSASARFRREAPGSPISFSSGRIFWGDARQTLQAFCREGTDQLDLIWHDAFSPQRCPQLWTLEFLTQLAGLLRFGGRWISYSSAAAVREALQRAGLRLAALQRQPDALSHGQVWSGGTVASPGALPPSGLWRPLSPMEQEHLACSAGEPYRDPERSAAAEQILRARQQAQAEALADRRRGSSSAWRQRWGVSAGR